MTSPHSNYHDAPNGRVSVNMGSQAFDAEIKDCPG
jgi:hypothetical protein